VCQPHIVHVSELKVVDELVTNAKYREGIDAKVRLGQMTAGGPTSHMIVSPALRAQVPFGLNSNAASKSIVARDLKFGESTACP
jgi:hypothetical protein